MAVPGVLGYDPRSMPTLRRLLHFSYLAPLLLGLPALGPAQTMLEYGHLSAGAGVSSSAARKSSPAAALERMKASLSGQSPSKVSPWGASASTPPAFAEGSSQAPSRSSGDLLTVVRIDWGSDVSQSASEEVNPKTELSPHVLDSPVRELAFDLAAAGLYAGMETTEVSKILGDPSIRTSGLAGRGYDEKLLYQLSSGWKIVVFAARGRALEFLSSPAAQKRAQNVLRADSSVIP